MSMEALLATFALTKDQVTPTEKLFLLSCARRSGEDYECWPSVNRLCADTGLDRKTVMKVRKSVIDKKLMLYSGELRGRSGQIPVMRLTYVSVDNLEKKTFTSPKSGTGTSPKSGTGTSPKSGTLNIKEENKKEKITLGDSSKFIIPNKKKEKLTSSNYKKHFSYALFSTFYEVYPKHRNQFKAFLAFIELKPTKELVEILIKDIKSRKAKDCHWRITRFIPQPSDYLKNEGWLDDIISENDSPSKINQQKIREKEEQTIRTKRKEMEEARHFRENNREIIKNGIRSMYDILKT